MRSLSVLALFLFTVSARAEGVAVSPDTPSAPPTAPAPSRPGKTPPECVKKVLDAIFEKEKAYNETKKAYSESLLEIRALSAIGVGCPGWELPEVKSTYGGTGYNAVMTETSTGDKWTINQDRTLVLDEKEVKPIVTEEPHKAPGLIILGSPGNKKK